MQLCAQDLKRYLDSKNETVRQEYVLSNSAFSYASVLVEVIDKVIKLFLIALVRGYQLFLSNFMGGQCRFEPTCSFYALEALETHNSLKAICLIVSRLAACRPYGKSGYDPIPNSRR